MYFKRNFHDTHRPATLILRVASVFFIRFFPYVSYYKYTVWLVLVQIIQRYECMSTALKLKI